LYLKLGPQRSSQILFRIWRASGKKKHIAGIIGKAIVCEECRPENAVAYPENLWHGSSEESKDKQIEVKAAIRFKEARLDPTEGMIGRALLERHEILSNMQIIKARTGSNFKISTDYARLISELWDSPLEEHLELDLEYSTPEGKIS